MKKAEVQNNLQYNSVFTIDRKILSGNEKLNSFVFKEFSLPNFVSINDRNLLDRVLNPKNHIYILNHNPCRKVNVKPLSKGLKVINNIKKRKLIDFKLPSKTFEKMKGKGVVKKYKLEHMTSINDTMKNNYHIKPKKPIGFDQHIVYRSTTDNFTRLSTKHNVSRTSINNYIPKTNHYKSITEHNKRRYTLSKLNRQYQASPTI